MDNPGDYAVMAPFAVTAALTRATGAQPWLAVDLSGITAVTLIAKLAYGSGGAAFAQSGGVVSGGCSCIVQAGSSVDASLALDIARFDFAQASRTARCNLEGLLSVAPADYADLTVEGRNDGLLLDLLRAVVLVGNTPYLNTTLSMIAGCR